MLSSRATLRAFPWWAQAPPACPAPPRLAMTRTLRTSTSSLALTPRGRRRPHARRAGAATARRRRPLQQPRCCRPHGGAPLATAACWLPVAVGTTSRASRRAGTWAWGRRAPSAPPPRALTLPVPAPLLRQTTAAVAARALAQCSGCSALCGSYLRSRRALLAPVWSSWIRRMIRRTLPSTRSTFTTGLDGTRRAWKCRSPSTWRHSRSSPRTCVRLQSIGSWRCR
mmetsp:Transcript_97600/g.271539  ORF Transcript_97600/g.271539 Transcript_97600/m.271539 type:complete len:226 (+) Transcript_97600:400-1077(+)